MSNKSAREIAFHVLERCMIKNSWSDAALKQELDQCELKTLDKSLCTNIVYGVLQNRAYLQFQLEPYLKSSWEKLDPAIQILLLMGSYQVLLLDRIPSHAVVYEMVETAKKCGHSRGSSLVNAILRALTNEKFSCRSIPSNDVITYLSIRYSMPTPLVQLFLSIYDETKVESYFKECNCPVPTIIQRNTLLISKLDFEKAASDNQLSLVPHPWLEDCYYLNSHSALEMNPLFQNGFFQIQDPAARVTALCLGPREGMKILDVCAAPGGKSFAFAMIMNDKGHILACDIHEGKLRQLQKQAKRLHITSIETKVKDGREENSDWNESFDGVLCDVPCSGLGIIRKKPDIRYRDLSQITYLPDIQYSILEASASFVKLGGVLIYSTCTLLPQENEQVIGRFLKQHLDFSLEPFIVGKIRSNGCYTFWPQIDSTDGFFIAKLRKHD